MSLFLNDIRIYFEAVFMGGDPLWSFIHTLRFPQVELVVRNLPANAGDLRDTGLIPQSGRSLGEGNGNLLQYSCLENPMNREAW